MEDNKKYEPENILDANQSAVSETFKRAEEFIELRNDKPKELRDINLGNAADFLGVTSGSVDELKESR